MTATWWRQVFLPARSKGVAWLPGFQKCSMRHWYLLSTVTAKLRSCHDFLALTHFDMVQCDWPQTAQNFVSLGQSLHGHDLKNYNSKAVAIHSCSSCCARDKDFRAYHGQSHSHGVFILARYPKGKKTKHSQPSFTQLIAHC
jgi:hypothetical protein